MYFIRLVLCLALCTFSSLPSSNADIYESRHQHIIQLAEPLVDASYYAKPEDVGNQGHDLMANNGSSLEDMLNAIETMQDEYFTVWEGTWPTAIDWTAAVLSTHLVAALDTLSNQYDRLSASIPAWNAPYRHSENLVNRYFGQLVGFYFAQDAFSLRQQAYDDMLWVVLGWLEGIKFINSHSDRHYSSTFSRPGHKTNVTEWHGRQWIPAFAHRARVFYDLAKSGWDTTLCGGGMLWRSDGLPYKNAITNELFIAASISMYLYFPGDDINSPFGSSSPDVSETRPSNPKHLMAAIDAYKWLVLSNMTNDRGLYTDGFHISGWRRGQNSSSPYTKCDTKAAIVFTYNQGVLLTGQRGLFQATAARSYLDDGHRLIKDVIQATGYNLQRDQVRAIPDISFLPRYQGIGRAGVLEDWCDARGDCDQDAQTFKGIFFHHLTGFCQPLPSTIHDVALVKHATPADLITWHVESCSRYKAWIRHNAANAKKSADSKGKFGMWWGVNSTTAAKLDPQEVLPAGVIDTHSLSAVQELRRHGDKQRIADRPRREVDESTIAMDPNTRGRGRTVETQSGGVSILRAWANFEDLT